MSLARNSGPLSLATAIASCLLAPSSATSQNFSTLSANTPASPTMVVIRGDAYALRLYPVGRVLAQNARVCLPPGAKYLTLQKTDGGTINFGAPGCNKVISDAEANRRKIGGGAARKRENAAGEIR